MQNSPKSQRGSFDAIEALIVLAIIGILATVGLPLISRLFTDTLSEGHRVGELVKVTNGGVWCKTWEGELKLQEGGSSESDNGRWKFTIENVGMAARCQGLLGKRVLVSYKQKGLNLNRCSGDSAYRALSVDGLDREKY